MVGMGVPGNSVSDTLKPHERPFTGMLYRHPRSASGRGRCSLSLSLCFSLGGPPLSVLARVGAYGVLADDGRRRVVAVGVQGPAIRIVSEDDAIGAQPVDQHGPVRRAGHLSGSAALRSGYPGRRGRQDGDSGQVRRDLVLADIGVLRPRGIGDGRAGVPVAAPVGGPAIGPRRFQPPSAPPARDQPGQQVPADRGSGRAARRGRVLRGDEISFADQRRVRRDVSR